VLLNEARMLAADGDDPQVVRQVLTALVDGFELDRATTFVDGWKAMLTKSRPAATVRTIYDDLSKRFDDAVVAADFDAAKKYATSPVRPRRDSPMRRSPNGSRTVARSDRAATGIRGREGCGRKMATAPDDAAANAVVGRYRAVVENDWPNAFPLLAKGNEEPWKELATKSLAAAPTPRRGPPSAMPGGRRSSQTGAQARTHRRRGLLVPSLGRVADGPEQDPRRKANRRSGRDRRPTQDPADDARRRLGLAPRRRHGSERRSAARLRRWFGSTTPAAPPANAPQNETLAKPAFQNG